MLFGHFLVPWGDNAADDLLVLDAKTLNLLHGNYSRFGFYHPGPWFLLVAAAGEYVFYDWTGCFSSYLGAQIFTISLTHGIALAICCRLWLLVTGRVSLGLLATLIIAATILAPVSPVNLLVMRWTPYAAVAASLLAATGLAGVVLRGPTWFPVMVLGCAQMIHAHASFLGIVPVMLGIALLLALLTGTLPFNLVSVRAVFRSRHHRLAVLFSAGIAALYALPIALHTILHWPGEFGRYRAFVGLLPPQPIGDALRYEAAFIPADGAWLLLLIPNGIVRGCGATSVVALSRTGLRSASLIVFFSAALPAFWYSWKGVDDTSHSYLLVWFASFVGTALVAALFHAAQAVRLELPWNIALYVVAVGVSLRVVFGLSPGLMIDVANNLAWQPTVARLLSEPAPVGFDKTELVLDRSKEAWGPAWIETVGVLDAMKRAGRSDYCVSPGTWHILFERSNRCDFQRDHITRRLKITLWPRDPPPSSVRLQQTGMIPMRLDGSER